MLSLNDLKEKKILFLSSYGEFPNELKFQNGNIALFKDGRRINKMSCHLVFSIFILGDITITSVLIRKAMRYGISFFFLDNSLSTYAEVMSSAEGNYRLREIQYRMSEESALDISKKIVINKLLNQEAILKKAKKQSIEAKPLINKVLTSKHISTLRGLEGNYAKKYFTELFSELNWYRRAPRAKEDIPNLLLDIGYTFLFNYVDSILRLFGFDTYKGIYHQLFFQRKSLSSDLMESIRPIIDYQLIKSFNLKQVNEKDFKYKNGSFSIKKYDLSKKYANIWLQLIMDNREGIYNYILSYYRHLFDQKKYTFEQFKP